MSEHPFRDFGQEYLSRGWHPIPLPAGTKWPPPVGWTGYAGAYADGAQVFEWAENPRPPYDEHANIGLRLGDDVIGLDVDEYDDKHGGRTVREAMARLFKLPAAPRLTSRDDGVSGIRFYRVPPGRRWAGALGPGVEVISWHERYAVAAPSIHPATDRPYRWLDVDGNPLGEIPKVTDLPDLPRLWVERLDAGDLTDAPDKTALRSADVTAWLTEHDHGTPCAYMLRLIEDMEAAFAGDYRNELAKDLAAGRCDGRHGITRQQVARIVLGADQGHAGLRAGLDTAEALLVAQRPLGDSLEVERMVAGAVGMRVAEPWPEADRGCCPGEPDIQPFDVVPAVESMGSTDSTESTEVSSWAPVDLSAVVAGLMDGTLTRPEPEIGVRTDGGALFYRGKVNGIAGASGSGKTWTALLAAAQVLADGGTVFYVDLEDDAAGICGRLLLDLGAEPAAVRKRFAYFNPVTALRPVERAAFGALARERRPDLAVIDSTGEALALAGLNANDGEEVAAWFKSLPAPLARLGAAVVVLDHVVKTDEGGLWPIGSQRKRAAIGGAQYMQAAAAPFARGHAGYAVIRCAKDRIGRYRPGETVAALYATPRDDRTDLTLDGPEAAPSISADRDAELMEKVSRYLEDHADSGDRTQRQARARVGGKQGEVLKALARLVTEHYVTTRDGPNRSKIHDVVRPFRAADDSASGWFPPDDNASGADQSGEWFPPKGWEPLHHSDRLVPGTTEEPPGTTRATGPDLATASALLKTALGAVEITDNDEKRTA